MVVHFRSGIRRVFGQRYPAPTGRTELHPLKPHREPLKSIVAIWEPNESVEMRRSLGALYGPGDRVAKSEDLLWIGAEQPHETSIVEREDLDCSAKRQNAENREDQDVDQEPIERLEGGAEEEGQPLALRLEFLQHPLGEPVAVDERRARVDPLLQDVLIPARYLVGVEVDLTAQRAGQVVGGEVDLGANIEASLRSAA